MRVPRPACRRRSRSADSRPPSAAAAPSPGACKAAFAAQLLAHCVGAVQLARLGDSPDRLRRLGLLLGSKASGVSNTDLCDVFQRSCIALAGSSRAAERFTAESSEARSITALLESVAAESFALRKELFQRGRHILQQSAKPHVRELCLRMLVPILGRQRHAVVATLYGHLLVRTKDWCFLAISARLRQRAV